MAGKFDDRQLRLQALRLSDPYDQPDLIFNIPSDAILLDIVNIYVFQRYPVEKVYCAKCGTRRHKFGFTALLASGNRLPLGSSCGAELFSESWDTAAKRIEERANRQFELKKLDRLATIIDELLVGLASWSRLMHLIAARRTALDNHLGELASRAREAVLHKNGALTAYRKSNNVAARAAGMKDAEIEFVVGRLTGGDFFDRLHPGEAIDRAVSCIEEINSTRKHTDRYATQTLTKHRRACERALEQVEMAARIHAGAQDFLTFENFRHLVDWANDHGITRDRYVLSEEGLVSLVGKSGRGLQILDVPDVDLRPLDLIREYRRPD